MHEAIADLFDDAHILTLPAGRYVFHAGDQVQSMHLIMEGRAELLRHSMTGAKLVLNIAERNDVVAEASAYSQTYHCDCIAKSDVTLRKLDANTFVARLHNSPSLSARWCAKLAYELQSARALSQVRSLKTVQMRLDAWLSLGNKLPTHGEIQDVAHVLGVSREALYREFARRRAYGIGIAHPKK